MIINSFVKPTFEARYKRKMKVRNFAKDPIAQSYDGIKELEENGKLQHIVMPMSSLESARLRGNDQSRFNFSGILQPGMKSITLE